MFRRSTSRIKLDNYSKKRENYRNAFYNFDVKKISKMKDRDIFMLLSNDGLIKNKLKLFSIRNNAIEFIKIQENLKVLTIIFGLLLKIKLLN